MASGKFQGVIRPTMPRGTWRVNSSERPSAGGKLAPSGSRAAAAWKRRIAAERATSPRASAIGLPTSRQISDASSPASTSSRSAAQRSASPRAAAVACAHPGAASAARRTAWSRSIPPDGRTRPTTSSGRAGFVLTISAVTAAKRCYSLMKTTTASAPNSRARVSSVHQADVEGFPTAGECTRSGGARVAGGERPAAAPGPLGGVHPQVGGAEQALRVVRVGREQPDADAGRGGEAAADVERPLEGLADAAGHALRNGRGRLGGDVAEHDQELVAAQADDQVGRTGRRAQPARDLLQQLVARVVAEGVVDVLELVDVEVEQRRGR